MCWGVCVCVCLHTERWERDRDTETCTERGEIYLNVPNTTVWRLIYAKSLLHCKVTYTQVLEIRHGHLWGPLFYLPYLCPTSEMELTSNLCSSCSPGHSTVNSALPISNLNRSIRPEHSIQSGPSDHATSSHKNPLTSQSTHSRFDLGNIIFTLRSHCQFLMPV